jgi:hypothetical protein
MHLGISLLDHWNPNLVKISATSEDWLLDFLALWNTFCDWNSIINNHINPLKVFKDSNDIKADSSVSMEDWRIYTVR